MLRRTYAFFFIILLAGYAAAGICPCLDGGERDAHACCKAKIKKKDSVSPANCCATDCAMRSGETVSQTRVESAARTDIAEDAAKAVRPAIHTGSTYFKGRVAGVAVHRHRLKHARPPDLFLLHSAFLI